MPRGCLSISEALSVFEAQPACMLREAVVILEDYILYAVEKRGLWAEVLDLEATVCAIKSELGRRGAFDSKEEL